MRADLSTYWKSLRRTKLGWVHPDDEELLGGAQHSFNLDFPPPAFVGDINNARIIILVANGGYHSEITPGEFESPDSEEQYLKRLANPESANWKDVAPYYRGVNYADLVFSGRAVAVNACAYRSRKISEEPENRKLIRQLPSSIFHRDWLVNTILPDLQSGKRIIVGKRHGLWELPPSIKGSLGFIADKAPISPHLSKEVWEQIGETSY